MDYLIGLNPTLVAKIQQVLAAMAALGYPMRICQGLRNTAQQQALYAQGRTIPGHIVTNADGIIHLSNHQAKADGTGYAVDCCFEGPSPFGDTQPWRAYGECGKALGLKWGGDFKSIVDRPHLELPA